MAYDSDPYAVLPPWLIGNVFEMPQSSQVVSANEGADIVQNQEKATDEPVAAADDASSVAVSKAKGNEMPDQTGEKGQELSAQREAAMLVQELAHGQVPDTAGSEPASADRVVAEPTAASIPAAKGESNPASEDHTGAQVAAASVASEKSESSSASKAAAAEVTAASVPAEKSESSSVSKDNVPAEIAASVAPEKSESSSASKAADAEVTAASVPAEKSESSSVSKDNAAAEVAASVASEKRESSSVSKENAAAEVAASVASEKRESSSASKDNAAAEVTAASVRAEKSESSDVSKDNAAAEVTAASVPAENSERHPVSEDRAASKTDVTSVPGERSSRSADIAMASTPRLPESLPQQTKQADQESPNKLALAARTHSQEHREAHGYISVQSKFESPRIATVRNGSLKHPNHPPNKQDYPAEPQGNPPQTQNSPDDRPQDSASRHRDSSSKPGKESADLQQFASDFVRTNQTGNVEDQHRFYADSVHYYGEGDLSWAGVAAATHRYQRQQQGRRYGAAAPAVVKGPVNGGFYEVDQPVSWTRNDGSRSTRGRSVLRLRVLPTGRSGWKITSIEEVGQ